VITKTARECVFNECKSGRNAFGPAFFDEHLSVVIEYATRLAKAFGADAEIVELAGWLHDLSAIRDFAALSKHPALSVEIARKMLQEKRSRFVMSSHIENLPGQSQTFELGGVQRR